MHPKRFGDIDAQDFDLQIMIPWRAGASIFILPSWFQKINGEARRFLFLFFRFLPFVVPCTIDRNEENRDREEKILNILYRCAEPAK